MAEHLVSVIEEALTPRVVDISLYPEMTTEELYDEMEWLFTMINVRRPLITVIDEHHEHIRVSAYELLSCIYREMYYRGAKLESGYYAVH